MRAHLRARIVDPLARQLTQGVSPGRLALAVALGLTLGSFPVLGTTTLLCAAAGIALGLNQPAIQLANYAAYPLQLALLVPFFRMGAWLFGSTPPSLSIAEVQEMLASDPWGTIGAYGMANLRAVAAWAVVAPIAAGALLVVLRPLLARLRAAARP